MKKSVLISIQPKWCELIASGKKTVEVRKTKPKIETPFKCYIYETQGRTEAPWIDEDGHNIFKGRGQVIGEFVCDQIDKLNERDCFEGMDEINNSFLEDSSCVDIDFILKYKGEKEYIYGWHISDLVIYDEPQELSEFIIPSKFGCVNEGKCRGCIYLDRGNGYNVEDDCNAWFSTDDYKPLRKAPQSWCYVEERRNLT